MTERLFYSDPYATEFDARVLRTEDVDGGIALILDKTFFYPEGGGQPADSGSIEDAEVVDVQKRGGEILHVVREISRKIKAGAPVHARVDWRRRHEYMQQHTGQHIISAALLTVGDHNTVSVHQGEEYTTIEVDSEEVPAEDISAVEELSNRIIREHRPVTDEWVSEAEIGNYPLRRPPKVSGTIRLVMIDDFDCVACGGVHARDTAEVGMVKCIGVEKIRGHARTVWKIGDRAYADYAVKHEIVSTLVQEFSAQPDELTERIRQQFAQLADVRREGEDLRRRLARQIAQRLYESAGEPVGVNRTGGVHLVTYRMEDEDKAVFRNIVEDLVRREACLFCLVNVVGDQLQWAMGAENQAQARVDFQTVSREMLPLIEGKGGGRAPIWQGAGKRISGVEELFARFREMAEATE